MLLGPNPEKLATSYQGLARAVWKGLRAWRLPPDLPPLDQLPFSYA